MIAWTVVFILSNIISFFAGGVLGVVAEVKAGKK